MDLRVTGIKLKKHKNINVKLRLKLVNSFYQVMSDTEKRRYYLIFIFSELLRIQRRFINYFRRQNKFDTSIWNLHITFIGVLQIARSVFFTILSLWFDVMLSILVILLRKMYSSAKCFFHQRFGKKYTN